ncbi:hypothetical protein ACHAQJ_009634 [Trichoderma viride]
MPVNFSPDRLKCSFQRNKKEESVCKFPFGTISVSWEPVERSHNIKIVATFEPGSRKDLELERLPFSYDDSFPGNPLKFERSFLMAKYFSGVYSHVPVTDTTSIGPLPAPSDSLKKRAEYYVRSTKLLRSLYECEPRCDKSCSRLYDGHEQCTEHCDMVCRLECSVDWSKPRAVTHVWFNEIERIKQRATTNGGDDEALLDFFIKSLEARPRFIQDVKPILTRFRHTE